MQRISSKIARTTRSAANVSMEIQIGDKIEAVNNEDFKIVLGTVSGINDSDNEEMSIHLSEVYAIDEEGNVNYHPGMLMGVRGDKRLKVLYRPEKANE